MNDALKQILINVASELALKLAREVWAWVE